MDIKKINYKEPDKIFIVIYRNREQHLEVFLNHMSHILEDLNHLILIVHQKDKRHFNRGALKNMGFKFIKNKFPRTYMKKTLIFHDVDHVVWKKGIFDFEPTYGTIKHHFGFPKKIVKSLGGIFSIKASDFEKINGFPNYWGWGYEDNCIYKRAENAGLIIDQQNFRHIKHKDVILFWHGEERFTNETYIWNKYENDNGYGIKQIFNVNFDVQNFRKNTIMLNINKFSTPGIYPKLAKKKPSPSFESTTHLDRYRGLFKR